MTSHVVDDAPAPASGKETTGATHHALVSFSGAIYHNHI